MESFVKTPDGKVVSVWEAVDVSAETSVVVCVLSVSPVSVLVVISNVVSVNESVTVVSVASSVVVSDSVTAELASVPVVPVKADVVPPVSEIKVV